MHKNLLINSMMLIDQNRCYYCTVTTENCMNIIIPMVFSINIRRKYFGENCSYKIILIIQL